MIELPMHELACLFPEMDDDEYARLKADIKANGQREPIMLLDGKVLDGRHRYLICRELGIKPTMFNFSGQDAAAFVESANLHRRHLSASQRAMVVVSLEEYRARKAPMAQQMARVTRVQPRTTPQDVTDVEPKLQTAEQLAAAAGVSPRTIKNARVAARAGLGDAVMAGDMSADQAALLARGKVERKQPKVHDRAKLPDDVPPVADDGELDELREKNGLLSDEIDRVTDRLAVAAMEGTDEERQAAADTIAELRAQVQVLMAEADALRSSRDTLQQRVAEMQKQILAQQRALKKAETAGAA